MNAGYPDVSGSTASFIQECAMKKPIPALMLTVLAVAAVPVSAQRYLGNLTANPYLPLEGPDSHLPLRVIAVPTNQLASCGLIDIVSLY